MKKLFLLMSITMISIFAHGQTPLSIDSCYARARQQYPLIRQKDLIEKQKIIMSPMRQKVIYRS